MGAWIDRVPRDGFYKVRVRDGELVSVEELPTSPRLHAEARARAVDAAGRPPSPPRRAAPSAPTLPFFEYRGGWRWCLLCGKWADQNHVDSNKHQYRAKNPTEYLRPDDFHLGNEENSSSS